MLVGLTEVEALGAKEIEMRADSQMVVNQVVCEYNTERKIENIPAVGMGEA